MTSLLPLDLLRGRNVFITGGGSGVNLAIARECAAAGANIGMCGRTESKLAVAAEELSGYGVKTSYMVADVRDEAAVAAWVAKTVDELGTLDAMVCGAAGNFLAPAETISTNGFRAVMEIDVLGSFHAAKAAFPHLCASGGALLFVSGGQSQMPFVHQAHVAAAKAGVEQLMTTLALEWGPLGIRSNSIVPGPVDGTEGMARLAKTAGADTWASMVPLGRFARQDEIGRIAALLISPVASFITGAQIVVDGGMSLAGSGAFNKAVLAAQSSA